MVSAHKASIVGVDQSDGAQTVTISEGIFSKPRQIAFTKHQITVEPDAATTGTVAVQYKPWGASTFIDLLSPVDGSPVVMDLSAADCILFEGHIEALKFTPTAVDDTYNIFCTSW